MTETTLSKTEISALDKKAKALLGEKGAVVVRLANPKKTGTITLREHYGTGGEEVYPLVDLRGQPKVFKFIKARHHFDLENKEHRILLYCLKHHPFYLSSDKPVLIIEDVEKEAEDFLSKRDSVAAVQGKISELKSDTEIKSMARALKLRVTNRDSSQVLKRAMYEAADNNPDWVVSRFEHPNLDLLKLLYDGLNVGAFGHANGVWTYGKGVMGSSEEDALSWLIEKEDLQPLIRQKIVAE